MWSITSKADSPFGTATNNVRSNCDKNRDVRKNTFTDIRSYDINLTQQLDRHGPLKQISSHNQHIPDIGQQSHEGGGKPKALRRHIL